MRRSVAVGLLLATAGCSSSHAPGATSTPSGSSPSPSAASPDPGVDTASRPPHLVITTTRWRLPVPLGREAVIGQGQGRYVVAGGLVAGDQSTADAFVMDVRHGVARKLPSLPVGVHDTAGVLLGLRSLVLGGGNSSEQDVVQSRGRAGWSVTGHLPQPRSDLSTARLGSQVMVIGGYDATSVAVPQIISSTDGTHWRTIGRLPVPVRYAASVVHDDAVWLFGGERDHVMQRAVQRIGPSGRARVVARMPTPLGHAVAVEVGSRILLIGGRPTYTTLTDQLWWFDPRTEQFQKAGRLPHVLADSAVAIDRKDVYLLGGESPEVTDQAIRIQLR